MSGKRQREIATTLIELKQEVEDKDKKIVQLQAEVSQLHDVNSRYEAEAKEFHEALDKWKTDWKSAVKERDEAIKSLGSQLLECQTQLLECQTLSEFRKTLLDEEAKWTNCSTNASEKMDISTQTTSDVEN